MVAGEVQTSPVFPPLLFPRLLRGSRAPNSNFSKPRTPFRREPRAGPVDFSVHRLGERATMSQVLFQELVPLQVKCKDCEERWGPRYRVPAGGGWGRAKGERWRLWPAAGCPAGLPGRGEGPGWNLMVTALPGATVAEGTKKGREEMGSRPASS